MLPCPSCHRHVRGVERTCPFCTGPLRSTKVRWLPRPAIVIAVGSALVACGTTTPDAGDTIETSSGDDMASSSGSTTDDDGMTSVPGTTDPTMAMTSSTSLGETVTGDNTTEIDDTLDTSCGFYGGCPDETGGVSYECDVYMQDCPEGEKCSPWANDGGSIWNASKCTPVGAAALGEPCTAEGAGWSGVDNCAPGSMCFHVDPDTLEGVCVEMCGGGVEQPTCQEGTCVVQHDGALPLCLTTCDPKASTCEKGENCEPVADETVDVDACTPS